MSKNQQTEKKVKLIDFNDMKDLKPIGSEDSNAFVCDLNTGICGPVNPKKEGKS